MCTDDSILRLDDVIHSKYLALQCEGTLNPKWSLSHSCLEKLSPSHHINDDVWCLWDPQTSFKITMFKSILHRQHKTYWFSLFVLQFIECTLIYLLYVDRYQAIGNILKFYTAPHLIHSGSLPLYLPRSTLLYFIFIQL